jgi:hypothetical protein
VRHTDAAREQVHAFIEDCVADARRGLLSSRLAATSEKTLVSAVCGHGKAGECRAEGDRLLPHAARPRRDAIHAVRCDIRNICCTMHYMANRDIFSDLTNLTHPLPDHPGTGADDELEHWSDWCRDVQNDRDHYEQKLRLSWEHGDNYDPLLAEIADARQALIAAQQRIRLLIAYGREFVEPRPYKLDDLARAAGMSISGVRTAYDDEEIFQVSQLIGAKLRRRDQDPA